MARKERGWPGIGVRRDISGIFLVEYMPTSRLHIQNICLVAFAVIDSTMIEKPQPFADFMEQG
jgi:hypothetical protein